jgi:hypothetical protein
MEVFVSKKITRKEGEKKISKLTQVAYDALKEAETVADASGVDFGFNPAYGMGGHYYPDPKRIGEWEGDPEEYDFVSEDGGFAHYAPDWADPDDGGVWSSSSSSC